MADIELVIKIPEVMYEGVKLHRVLDTTVDRILEAVENGTPIPEGHGRLVDADALEKKMCDREEELGDDQAMWESSAVSVALDMFAPTIIEAKKGAEK